MNGAPVGSHTGGFTPFEFEVTGFLVNGSNSIVVKADNTRKKENVPTEDFDWWNYGGITRNVMLEERPATLSVISISSCQKVILIQQPVQYN